MVILSSPATTMAARVDRPGDTVIVALLATGLVLFAADFDLRNHLLAYAFVPLAAVIGMLPALRDQLRPVLDRVRSPSTRMKAVTFAVVFVLSSRYFLLNATWADRGLFPTFHDEFMYLLQAQMLARGRLWMPPHELAPFFDSFNIIVKPVYAAEYFPGTALFYVPGVWLKLAPWATSTTIAGLAMAMLYLVITRLIDGVSGLLAVLLALSLHELRGISVMTMSHPVMLLLLLSTIWAYLRWCERSSIRWAAAIGIFGGWSAIARPLDAVVLLLPVGIAFLWQLRAAAPVPRRRWLCVATVILGAAPFLSMQFIFDKKVTGSLLRTPFGQYAAENVPSLTFGFGPRTIPTTSPSHVPQVRDYYATFLRPDLTAHGRDGFLKTWLAQRLQPAADVALPNHLLLVLLPLGLLTLHSTAHRALVAGIVLLPLAYTFYPSYLRHYALVLAPAITLLALGGADMLRRRFTRLDAAIPLAIIALTIPTLLPPLRAKPDHFMQSPYLADVNEKLAHLERTPAVVLFRYESGRTNVNLVHHEPVFNIETAWPDDATIIRAHDLGTENWRIYDYYARRQPNRYFYLYDRSSMELSPLGWATDLAARGRGAP